MKIGLQDYIDLINHLKDYIHLMNYHNHTGLKDVVQLRAEVLLQKLEGDKINA